MKQSKLRKRRVWRFAALYLTMLVLFLGLLIGPIVGGGKISGALSDFTKNPDQLFNLMQPVGLNNNDTLGTSATGTGAASNTGAAGNADSTGAPSGGGGGGGTTGGGGATDAKPTKDSNDDLFLNGGRRARLF
jgi:1,3-beta-glucan synthase